MALTLNCRGFVFKLKSFSRLLESLANLLESRHCPYDSRMSSEFRTVRGRTLSDRCRQALGIGTKWDAVATEGRDGNVRIRCAFTVDTCQSCFLNSAPQLLLTAVIRISGGSCTPNRKPTRCLENSLKKWRPSTPAPTMAESFARTSPCLESAGSARRPRFCNEISLRAVFVCMATLGELWREMPIPAHFQGKLLCSN